MSVGCGEPSEALTLRLGDEADEFAVTDARPRAPGASFIRGRFRLFPLPLLVADGDSGLTACR